MTAKLYVASKRPHQPVNMGSPDEPSAKCRTRRVEWPCIEYVRLTKAKEARR